MTPSALQDSAMRRLDAGACGREYSKGSPLLRRAQPSSLGPAEMLPLRPSAAFQSSDRVRGERPPSTVAMIAGQASSVESKRARILLEGMSRSEYPTAPSMQISVFSPGLRANRLGRGGMEKSISGISRSQSSSDVFTAFALRGAPCGDDPRPRAARRGYHDDDLARERVSDRANASLPERMPVIGSFIASSVFKHLVGLLERHAVFPEVGLGLLRIPPEPGHRRTVATGPYPGITS